MSDPGSPPLPAPAPASPLRLALVVLAAVVPLALAVVLAVVLVQDLTKDDPRPSYPAKWDARIEPFAKAVEEERGLLFAHPVEVRFLEDAEFEESVTNDRSDLDDQRAQVERATGLMRAVGLLTGDVDLFQVFNDATGSGALAFYSYDAQSITIRGTKLTRAAQPTLVHELTHALQDQYFKIGERQAELREERDAGAVNTTADVLDAVIEGDAQRIATAYIEGLPAAERKAVDKAAAAQNDAAGEALKDIPEVVVTMISSPYVLGEALVQAVASKGTNRSVDTLLTDPPQHDAVLLDPFSVIADETDAIEVAVPVVRDGEEQFESGEFGALTWYFVLAERMPVTDALAAADAWGGDAAVYFERDGTSCVRSALRGDSDAGTKRLERALERWIAADPDAPASVEESDGTLTFESCDPGTTTEIGKDASEDALTLVMSRTYLGIGILKGGVTETAASCMANRLIREFSISELAAVLTSEKQAAKIIARTTEVATACKVQPGTVPTPAA